MTFEPSPFASPSIPRHIARGAAGLLAVAGSAVLLRTGGPLGILGAVGAAGLAIVLLRGCPLCWVIGLVETVALRGSRNRLPAPSAEGDPL